MKGWIAFVVCVVLASCRTPEPVVEASPAAPPVPLTVEELITSLGHLEEVSDGRVAVNPGLSALCRGPSTEEIAEARKEFGPHALAFIRVSMNERAASAFASGKSYPVGSAVIKFKDAAVSGGIGGMIKREPGYDEFGGDWEYFYAEHKGLLHRGQLETCRNCHMTTRSTDHVFGSWKAKRP